MHEIAVRIVGRHPQGAPAIEFDDGKLREGFGLARQPDHMPRLRRFASRRRKRRKQRGLSTGAAGTESTSEGQATKQGRERQFSMSKQSTPDGVQGPIVIEVKHAQLLRLQACFVECR